MACSGTEEEGSWSERLPLLRSGVRSTRRDALKWAAKTLAGSREAPERFDEIREALLAAIADDSEACREAAVEGARALLAVAPKSDYVLTYYFAALRGRLAGAETAEPSEELRLRLSELLLETIALRPDAAGLEPFYDDCVDCLIRTLADDYAEVKKCACRTTVALAEALPERFRMRAEALIEPTANNVSHRHFRVRAAAAECAGAIALRGNEKCFEAIVPLAAKLLLDDNATVRLQIVKETARWALEHPDRYSHFHRLIPLILTGLGDASEETSAESKSQWEKIGLQYMEENDEALKMELMFSGSSSTRYPAVVRPNMGCRTLVSRNMGKILPAVLKELEGWISEIRHRSSQILSLIILHAESKNVQYSSDIINCLLRGAKDTSDDVVLEINRASEYLGYFVEPDIWWNFMIGELESWPALIVLTNIIKGADPELLNNKYLKKIMKELSCSRFRTASEPRYQINLLHLCESLMNVCGIHCQSAGQEMFNILFTVYAMPTKEDIEHRALCLLGKFRETIQVGSNIEDLYCIFIRSLLANITTDALFWTETTPEKFILKAVLLHSGYAVGLHLHLISPLLVEILTTPGISSEIKVEIFTSLCSMLLQRDERLKLTEPFKLNAFMNVMLYDLIRPTLHWAPGKISEALRTISVCCLCAILQDGDSVSQADENVDFQKCVQPIDLFPDVEDLEKKIEILLPLIVSLLSDQPKNTKQYALKAICCLVKIAKKKNCFKVDHLHKTYSEVLARLNDPSDNVRRSAVETLCILFMARPEPYDVVAFNTHIDALYSAMLPHLDDSDTIFQENVLDALKKICVVHPKLLKGKVDASTKLYRNQKALEHLDKHLESLSI